MSEDNSKAPSKPQNSSDAANAAAVPPNKEADFRKIDEDKLAIYNNKNILVFGKGAASREMLSQPFRSLHCHMLQVSTMEGAITMIDSPMGIDLILMEVDSTSECFPLIDALNARGDKAPPLFLFSTKVDADFEEAFFRGVEAIFFRPLDWTEVIEGIAFSVGILLDRSERRHKRRRLRRARLEFRNEATGLSSSGHVLNISEGGMYVCSMYNHPGLFNMITFRLLVDHENPKEIAGRAVVRWVKDQSERGRAPGFGVEFKDLDDDSSSYIKSLLQGA